MVVMVHEQGCWILNVDLLSQGSLFLGFLNDLTTWWHNSDDVVKCKMHLSIALGWEKWDVDKWIIKTIIWE